MELRPYQAQALQTCQTNLRTKPGENGNVVIPCGGGKSITIARLAEWVASYDNCPVLLLADRQELLTQNGDKFTDPSKVGYYSAGLNQKDTSRPITIAGIQSCYNVPLPQPPKIILIDESQMVPNARYKDAARTVSNGMYWSLLNRYPESRIIGFTATPWRTAEGKPNWCKIWHETTYPELVKDGYLVELRYNVAPAPDGLQDVQVKLGDYITSQLQDVMAEGKCLQASIRNIMKYGRGRKKWLGFCTTQLHVELVVRLLWEQGVKALPITNKTPREDREWGIENFRNGDVPCLVTIQLLNRGNDFPCADFIFDLEPTKSKNKHEQKNGRLTRPIYAPGYDLSTSDGRLTAIAMSSKPYGRVLDQANNVHENGFMGATEWRKMESKERPAVYMRICSDCELAHDKPVAACVACGYPFPPKEEVQRLIDHDLNPKETHKWLAVTSIETRLHRKKDAPHDTLRLIYHCGYSQYTDWLALDHPVNGGRKYAVEKCARLGIPAPVSVKDGLAMKWPTPARIYVNMTKKHPEVEAVDMSPAPAQQQQMELMG